MLQSKAGIENREYQAQRSLLADVDAGTISREEFFAHADQLLKARLPAATPHKAELRSHPPSSSVSPALAPATATH
jgi:pyruvate-ferredoxin/flavodoxin oxidoreductase